MRPALAALALSVTLVACDSSGPGDLPPVAPGFEATVTAEAGPPRVITGAAEATDRLGGIGISVEVGEGATLSAFQLDAEGSDEFIYLVGLTGGELAEGTYEIGGPDFERDGEDGPFVFLGDESVFLGVHVSGERSAALGTSGTVEITEIGDASISGAFDFEATSFAFSPDGPPAEETVRIEGTFTVERQERP